MLASLLGKHGELIYDYANGRDESKVDPSGRERLGSIGNGITFKRDLAGAADLRRGCMALADTVAGRLRKHGLKCHGVKVDIKDPFFKTISRQKQLDQPSNTAAEISRAAMEIIGASWDLKSPVRMLTITGINLTGEDEDEQIGIESLTGNTRERNEKMERALDSIRKKYGRHSIAYGGMLGEDIGINLFEDQEEEIIMINEGEGK